MASTIFLAPKANFLQTTLNGAINDSATTITLTSATNVDAPGYAVIDRQNSAGVATPNSREVISFTGVSGNDLTGCVRPADGSTARAHNDGAIVEFTPTIGMWNSLATIVSSGFDGSGYLKAINSPVSLANLRTKDLAVSSVASIAKLMVATNIEASGASVVMTDVRATRSLNASGASLLGFPAVVMWEVKASLSGATTILRTPVPIHRAGNWRYANFITRTVASAVSAIVDINKNGTSIFAALGRPMIAAGGTFASTASIATKGFDQGDRFSIDYDGTGGHITDIIAMLVSE